QSPCPINKVCSAKTTSQFSRWRFAASTCHDPPWLRSVCSPAPRRSLPHPLERHGVETLARRGDPCGTYAFADRGNAGNIDRFEARPNPTRRKFFGLVNGTWLGIGSEHKFITYHQS